MAKMKLHPYTVICLGVALALCVSITGMALRPPGATEFRVHRTRYEQIVARVKAIGIEPNSNPHLWMSADLNPNTLSRKRINNADMVGMVQAYRDATTGAYEILITTQDQGHLGTFGYGYSDTSNHPPTVGYWTAERQLDAHWHIMANRSW